MREWFSAILLAGVAGCAGAARKDLPAVPEKKPDSRSFVGWRLAERTYGSIDDWWATAGDGEIPGDAVALVYEPVYREEKTLLEGLVTGRTACSHAPRVEYAGQESRNVGDHVKVTVWIDGPADVGHVVEFSGSHGAVKVLSVTGAARLLEESASSRTRYYLAPRARAEVTFTSEMQGRAGLRISVVGDIVSGGGTDRLRMTDTAGFAPTGAGKEQRR